MPLCTPGKSCGEQKKEQIVHYASNNYQLVSETMATCISEVGKRTYQCSCGDEYTGACLLRA